MESALLTGLGLAAPAGLNAYVPLLILALSARFSSAITLERPYHFLSSNWGIAVVVLLLTIEVVVDKVPGLDHANDLVQSAIRPAAGAVLAMAATSNVAALNPVLSLILGLLAAGGVHAAKATARPAVTLGTGGIGNPLVSLVEDAAAAVAAVLAIFLPILSLAFLLLLVVGGLWAYRGLRRRLGSPSNLASGTLRR